MLFRSFQQIFECSNYRRFSSQSHHMLCCLFFLPLVLHAVCAIHCCSLVLVGLFFFCEHFSGTLGRVQIFLSLCGCLASFLGGGYPELMWWFLQGISCVTLWCAVRVSSCLKVQKLRQKSSKLVTSVPKNSTENLVFYKFLHHTPRFRGLSLQCASCRSWFLERIMLCFSVTFIFPASADFL